MTTAAPEMIHLEAVDGVSIKAMDDAGPGPIIHIDPAYPGWPMKVAGFTRSVVVDLAGLAMAAEVPLVRDHDTSTRGLLGTVRPKTDGNQLNAEGVMNRSQAAAEILRLWRSGQKLSASIGATVLESHKIKTGDMVHINGRSIVAPKEGLIVVDRAELKEISIVGVGAATGTNITIEARHSAKGATMSKEATIQNDELATERQRAKDIIAICSEHQSELKAAGNPDLAARAIDEGLSIDDVKSEILAAVRKARPHLSVSTGSAQDRPTGPKVLAAAALLCGGQQEAAEATYDERTLQAAADLRLNSGVELAREANRMATGRAPSDTGEMIQAAFSTSEFGRAMADAGRTMLQHGYHQAEQNDRLVARMVPVPDLKENQAIRPYTGDSLLEQVGPDGEVKHTSLGEASYPVQAHTFARMVGITRKTLINDGELGGVFEIERAIGLSAGRTRNKAVWLALRNASGFFVQGNGNKITGADSALSVEGLSKAVAALRQMADDAGEPIGLQPHALVVPPALEAPARMLLGSVEVATDGDFNTNPWRGLAKLAVVPHLAAANGGDDDTWYLSTVPSHSAGLFVALLNGKDAPTVERFDVGANYLGIQLRCVFDFGVALGDPKAIIRSVGK
jgi:hypothetical protein